MTPGAAHRKERRQRTCACTIYREHPDGIVEYWSTLEESWCRSTYNDTTRKIPSNAIWMTFEETADEHRAVFDPEEADDNWLSFSTV